MTTWTHPRILSAPPRTAADRRTRDDGLLGVVRVVGVAGLTIVAVVITSLADLDPGWATAGAAAALVLCGRHLTPGLAVLAVALAWCLVTGFAVNDAALLTFAGADLARLGALTGVALLLRWDVHRTHRLE